MAKSENVKSELKLSRSGVIKVVLICPIQEIDTSIHIHIFERETFLIMFNLSCWSIQLLSAAIIACYLQIHPFNLF